MISFDLSTLIYRPISQVFRFVATPENDFQWQYGTLTSDQLSNGETGMGTLFRAISHFMGQRTVSVFEVTDFEPHQRYGFKSISGPIVSRTLYTFEMQADKSLIRLAVHIDPQDFFKQTMTLVEKGIKKQYRENFALLKSVLETSQVEQVPQRFSS